MSEPRDASRPDTQWPRWEVFKQDAPGRPHQAVGSVHAADPDHALVTARNVFARRPAAVSMWIARADAVFSRTREQLEAEAAAPAAAPTAAPVEEDAAASAATPGQPRTAPTDAPAARTYLVFRKSSHRRSMTFGDHVGEVSAASPEGALRAAVAAFDDAPALAWWLVAADAVQRSEPDDVDAWFGTATDKTYKQQSAYGTVAAERNVRGRAQESAGNDDHDGRARGRS